MKEELLKLKGIAKELPVMLRDYNEAKAAINEGIEENTDIIRLLNAYYDCTCDTYYDEAIKFYETHKFLYEAANEIREEHPKYGDKRIAKSLFERFSDSYETRRLNEAISLYIMLKNVEFDEILEQYENIKSMEEESGLLVTDVAEEAKQRALDTGKKVVGAVSSFARPYGEVAAAQFFTAKEKTKSVLSSGSKRLAKILNDFADKTSSDNK